MSFKDIGGYKIFLEDLINKKNKSLDYINGYIICLKDHNHLSIEEALDLLKYTSTIYFKKMGWE